MSRLARVSIPQALGYRGGQPMIAWLLHRIAGIGIVLFVGMHVFAGFFLYAIHGGTANTIANALTSFYESRPVQVFVLFASSIMASTGCGSWCSTCGPACIVIHREAMWVQWAVFLPLFLIPAFLIALGVKGR